MLGAVSTHDLSHPRTLAWACRAEPCEQLTLALERRSGDLPTHGQPLEQELDRPLPGVLSR